MLPDTLPAAVYQVLHTCARGSCSLGASPLACWPAQLLLLAQLAPGRSCAGEAGGSPASAQCPSASVRDRTPARPVMRPQTGSRRALMGRASWLSPLWPASSEHDLPDMGLNQWSVLRAPAMQPFAIVRFHHTQFCGPCLPATCDGEHCTLWRECACSLHWQRPEHR